MYHFIMMIEKQQSNLYDSVELIVPIKDDDITNEPNSIFSSFD